jgi:hypothetical protein
MHRESGTAAKSETGKRIETGRSQRMLSALDGDFVTGDSISFCPEVSGIEVFCFVR